MNKKASKTTEKDFEVFKKECEYWIRYFGLLEYKFVFFHEKIDEAARIVFHSDRSNRIARVSLGKDWESDYISDYQVALSAFHEIAEALLWGIGDMAAEAYGNHKERDATHKLIRIFENTIFEESYQRRYGSVKSKRI